MAVVAITDAKIYVGAYNLSGYANEISLSVNPELLNSTTFGTGTKKNTPGLMDISGMVKGFLDYADFATDAAFQSLDSLLFGRIGATSAVFSAAALGNAEGDPAYGLPMVSGKINPLSGQVGALLPWELDVRSNGITIFRGFVAAVGSKSVTGQTSATIQVVGGVPTGSKLYANLHVVSVSGTTPTLDVIVQSDDNSSFTTPTTRLTFAQVTTTISSEHKSAAGPITDEYYRMKWTLAGTSPVYVVFGILAIK